MNIVDYESIKYNAYNIALLIIFLLGLVRLIISDYQNTIKMDRKKKEMPISSSPGKHRKNNKKKICN